MVKQKFEVQGFLFAQIGDIAREIVVRALQYELSFLPGEFDTLLGLMQVSHVQALSYVFTDVNRVVSTTYAPQFIDASKALLVVLERNYLVNEANNLRTYLQKVIGNLAAASGSLEGTYRVRTEDGKYWRFTLIFARHDMLVAGIGEESKGFVYYAYYNVGYDLPSQTYVAAERNPGEENIRNAVIRFRFPENGGITGQLNNIPGVGNKVFSGSLIEPYTDFLNRNPNGPVTLNVDGMYVGDVKCDDFNGKIALYVNTVNGNQLGRISFNNEQYFIDFPFGLKGNNKGLVYLTSAKLGSRSFVHFRGSLAGDVLSGEYVIGGQGKLCKNLALKKVK
jgi:hypothetical protein